MGDLLAEYDGLLQSFKRTIRSKSPKTFAAYVSAAELFRDWLAGEDDPDEVPEPVDRPEVVAGICVRHVHGFMNQQEARGYSPATRSNRYRSLQQFLNFLVREDELDEHPMARMKPPEVPTKRVETVAAEHLQQLFAWLRGKGFTQLRDTAIIALYVDSGARLSEVAGLNVADVDVKQDCAYATGKGNKPRVLSFGNSTGLAIERYMRVRAKHALGARPELWLAEKVGPMTGVLTVSGIHKMIKRRCEQAGIPELHAHQFRHTMATAYLDGGGELNDLMRLGGWESLQMVKRYTDTTADRRAVAAHKKHSLVDKVTAPGRRRK